MTKKVIAIQETIDGCWWCNFRRLNFYVSLDQCHHPDRIEDGLIYDGLQLFSAFPSWCPLPDAEDGE